MTYSAGSPILATDYNGFALGVNQIYADQFPGSTTLPNAGFGYGQPGAIASVVIDNNILASEWAALFDTMKDCGAHQGTTVIPPLPVSNPVIGDVIVALPPVGAVDALVNTLAANKFNIAPGQSTLTAGTNYIQPGAVVPWTSTLTFEYQVNFGSWDNARYFFNSGGKLLLNGSMAPAIPGSPTPVEAQWESMLATMSPLTFNYNSTQPGAALGGTPKGFYDLTTVYQQVYNKTFGASTYYSNNTISVYAKLASAAGTDGIVNFSIVLTDNDTTPDPKSSITTYRVDNIAASGASVSYPGTVSVAPVGVNNGFVAT